MAKRDITGKMAPACSHRCHPNQDMAAQPYGKRARAASHPHGRLAAREEPVVGTYDGTYLLTLSMFVLRVTCQACHV